MKVSPPLVPYRETVAQPATSEFLRPLCDTPAASLIGAEGTEIVAGLDPVHYLPAPWVDTPGLDKVRHGQACAVAGNGNLSISLSCSSIPPLALAYLMELSDQDLASSEQSTLLVDRTMSKQIEQVSSAMSGQGLRCLALVLETATSVSINDKPDDFRHVAQATWAKLSHLLSPLSSVDSSDTDLSFKQLISLGPDTKGPNLLMLSKNMRICIWKSAESMPLSQTSPVDADVLQAPSISLLDGLIAELDPFLGSKEACDLFQSIWSRLLRHAIVTGFQVTCAHGPMMEEPLQGVCFFVNNVDISCSELPRDILEQLQQMLSRDTSRKSDAFSATTVLATTNIMAGHLIPEVLFTFKITNFVCVLIYQYQVKNTMRNVMMGSNMRVVEPVFSCSVQCDQSQLG